MLTDGFYAEVALEDDPLIAQEGNGRPFRIAAQADSDDQCQRAGDPGQGPCHLFQEISPDSHLISGGKATVAKMFVNNGNGQRGLVCQNDVVCFDEIAGVSFDQKDGVNILKGYMGPPVS